MKRALFGILQWLQTLFYSGKQHQNNDTWTAEPDSRELQSPSSPKLLSTSFDAEPDSFAVIPRDEQIEKTEPAETENLTLSPLSVEVVEIAKGNLPGVLSVAESEGAIDNSFTTADATQTKLESTPKEDFHETVAPILEAADTSLAITEESRVDSNLDGGEVSATPSSDQTLPLQGESFTDREDQSASLLPSDDMSPPAALLSSVASEVQNVESTDGAPEAELASELKIAIAPTLPIPLAPTGEVREVVEESTEAIINTPVQSVTKQANQLATIGEGRKATSSKVNRPGRRGEKPAGEKHRKKVARILNPELVCWKRGGQWYIGIEVPEARLDQDVEIIQGGKALSPAGDDDSRYVLETTSNVSIGWIEDADAREFQIDLSADDFLIFKLIGRQDEGRRVVATTSGSYLAIAPIEWTRDEQVADTAPVAPERVIWENYQGHYFDLDGSAPIAFRNARDQSVLGSATAAWFDLIGTRIQDATPKVGPLYGGDLPKIQMLGQHQWNEIKTIIVGEEGKLRDYWRDEITPDLTQAEQLLPEEISELGVGWYFVRLYNMQDDLLDSLDFRFVAGLNVIVHQDAPLPRDSLYHAARLEFHHFPNCVVQPAQADVRPLALEQSDRLTLYEIPPKAVFDKTTWQIGTIGEREIEITISLERIWWALGKGGIVPHEWSDRQVALSRSDIEATSDKTLWVKLPLARWTDAISIGLGNSEKRYRVLSNEDFVAVPLREFADIDARRKIGSTELVLSVTHSDKRYQETIGQLNVRAKCKKCDFTTEAEQDISSHFQTIHLESEFHKVVLQESGGDAPSVTHTVFKCLYCGKSYAIESPRAGTKMWRHVKLKHGRPKGVYAVIETRETQVSDEANTKLVITRKCRFCGAELPKPDMEAQYQHLWDMHRNQLYELV